jgi:hypothetical protein
MLPLFFRSVAYHSLHQRNFPPPLIEPNFTRRRLFISARLCYETSQAARKTIFLANKLFFRVRCRTQLLFLGPIPARDFGCARLLRLVFSGPAISCIMHESAGFLAGVKTNGNVVGYERQRESQPRGQWLRKYPRIQQVVVAKD